MENHVLSLFVALVATTGSLSTAAQTQKAYAVEKGDTLTFYYDDQRATREGIVYDMPAEENLPEWTKEQNGTCERITQVEFDASFAAYRPTSTYCWFYHCSNIQKINNFKNLNTSEVTDMSGMFDECNALQSLDLTGFNTANVTDMGGMFSRCIVLKSLDLSNFNTANVTNMFNMFYGCEALESLDLTNFNTANVIEMTGMFAFCKTLKSLDLTSFNTANVIGMTDMFRRCYELTTIYNNWDWKDHKVARSDEMFIYCKKLVGAVPYNANRIDITMANPKTGYFTAKQATSIDVVTDDQASDSEAYDLSGRRVGNDYHGIVVKNRKKMVQP